MVQTFESTTQVRYLEPSSVISSITHKSCNTITVLFLTLLTILPGQATATEPVAREQLVIEPENTVSTTRALLVPVTESRISSQMTGRITHIAVKEGGSFTKDQVLITFDCSMQKAKLKKAMASLDAAKSTHDANLRLREFDSIGQLELDLSNAEINKASADVSVATAEVSHCSVTAPYSGRVAKLNIHTHDSVAVNKPLIEILDDSILEIRMYAPASWLAWIKPGTEFQLHVDETNQSYMAKITRLGARVDPTSHSFDMVGVLVSDQERLLAGMSGTATFTEPHRN